MADERVVLLDHGGGGRLSAELVERLFLPRLGNPTLARLDDGAVLDNHGGGRLAFSTDTYTVTPLFFPGGDIGRLAVCGTVNDLAMCGARPRWLSAGFILEEGFPLADLERIADSMAAAAREAGVQIVTGDTKVVPRGAADGVFINTAGIGLVPQGVRLGGGQARDGDVVLVSGFLGDHGMTILTQREGLELGSGLCSDAAPLNYLVERLLGEAPGTRVLRDPTRGGLGATLNEIAAQSGVEIELEEECLPLRPAVRGACELLGLDPLYLANEGKLLAVVPEEQAEAALAALRGHPHGAHAAQVGRVRRAQRPRVVLRTTLGTTRLVDWLSGEQLPRIC